MYERPFKGVGIQRESVWWKSDDKCIHDEVIKFIIHTSDRPMDLARQLTIRFGKMEMMAFWLTGKEHKEDIK